MITLYPVGYDSEMVSIDELRRRHERRMHPEFARRLFAWIEHRQGQIGIGGGFRTTQPVKPGFAPPGRSFHQMQTWASGLEAYAAVDLVVARPGGRHRAPYWSEVPAQGSDEARQWGVHVNVGTEPRGEPWHMQPVEVDGYDSWLSAGRPEPAPDYPIPGKEPQVQIIDPITLVDTRSGAPLNPGVPMQFKVPAEVGKVSGVVIHAENISRDTGATGGHLRIAGSQAALDRSPGIAHTEADGVNSDTAFVKTGGEVWCMAVLHAGSTHVKLTLVAVEG